MKFTNRGFTLVELMIVIAIIGVLAAALFPSLTSYIASSRDSARMTAMYNIKVAASEYFTNNDSFSGLVTPGYCLNYPALLQYMGNKFSFDGNFQHANCGNTGIYAAGTGRVSTTDVFIIYATMESPGKGNTGVINNMNIYNGIEVSSILTAKTGGSNRGYLQAD